MTTVSEQLIVSFEGDYRFLSNFYEGEPLFHNGLFATAEHLYMSLKTEDFQEAAWVASAPTPGEAKRRGQQVTLRPGWNEGGRDAAMRTALGAKFLKDWHLQRKLLNTGDALLVEGNTWHDRYWGICYCDRESCQGQGENMLGKLLMELRDDLRKWS